MATFRTEIVVTYGFVFLCLPLKCRVFIYFSKLTLPCGFCDCLTDPNSFKIVFIIIVPIIFSLNAKLSWKETCRARQEDKRYKLKHPNNAKQWQCWHDKMQANLRQNMTWNMRRGEKEKQCHASRKIILEIKNTMSSLQQMQNAKAWN